MKYVCLGYMDPTQWMTMSDDERNTFIDECFHYDDELRKKGHFVGGEALQGAEAMRRIAGFVSFRIRHVRREDNREADRLVNVVLDRVVGAAGGETIRIVDLPAPRPAEVDHR